MAEETLDPGVEPEEPTVPAEGAGGGEETPDARETALMALAEADPEAFDEYMQYLEAKGTPEAGAEGKDKDDGDKEKLPPPEEIPPVVAPEKPADGGLTPDIIDEHNFTRTVATTERTLNQIFDSAASTYDQLQEAKASLGQMNANGEQGTTAYQMAVRYAQGLQSQYNQQYERHRMIQAAHESLVQSANEVNALPILRGNKALYAELRLAGIINDNTSLPQTIQAINNARVARGLLPLGKDPPAPKLVDAKGEKRAEVLSRLKKLNINIGNKGKGTAAKAGGGAGAGLKFKGDYKGDADAQTALERLAQ